MATGGRGSRATPLHRAARTLQCHKTLWSLPLPPSYPPPSPPSPPSFPPSLRVPLSVDFSFCSPSARGRKTARGRRRGGAAGADGQGERLLRRAGTNLPASSYCPTPYVVLIHPTSSSSPVPWY
eukprot:2320581-Rhodomonas_salina.3